MVIGASVTAMAKGRRGRAVKIIDPWEPSMQKLYSSVSSENNNRILLRSLRSQLSGAVEKENQHKWSKQKIFLG